MVSIPNRDFDELQLLQSAELLVSFSVSIPNRDFDELQYIAMLTIPVDRSVSIPNRDFDELQYVGYLVECYVLVFQSLIGILMNCNAGV